ncbi:MAG: DUF4238 domain-containing protein [Planctomycetes bacterium]|nr:DUF4238 domain-containing protein [Planctomycetota bacterium]
MGKHYTPQEYLRAFADPYSPNLIWQFDKQTGTFSSTAISIKKVAQQRDFYSQEDEDKLTKLVENPGNAVLRKLRSENFILSDGERVALSVYMATTITRIPKNRIRARELAPQVLSKVTEELREKIRLTEKSGLIGAEVAEKGLTETDALKAKYTKEMPQEIEAQIDSPWPSQRMFQTIYDMEWRFLKANSSHYFLTSDNPAYFFDTWGLKNDNGKSELTFPISSKVVLLASWTPIRRPADRIVKDAKIAKEVNKRMIVGATRFVFSRTKANWIAKVAQKEVADLNRIEWYPGENLAGLTMRPGRPWF